MSHLHCGEGGTVGTSGTAIPVDTTLGGCWAAIYHYVHVPIVHE